VTLALLTDREGILEKAAVIESREDGPYFNRVLKWIPQKLERTNIFRTKDQGEIDALSGATVSANAVVLTVRTAGHRFAEMLGIESSPPDTSSFQWRLIFAMSLLAVFTASCLVMRRAPAKRWRILFLLIMFLVIGVLYNIQYSARDVATLSSPAADMPFFRMSIIIPLAVPLIVMLFGNVFCGWVCPFGAIQELVGELRPAALSLDPPDAFRIYGQCMKYVLLFLILTGLLSAVLLNGDPLATVFALDLWGTTTIVVLLALTAGAFFYRRFWCRYLCPAGAFLSLFSRSRIVRPLVPRINHRRCDMGVMHEGQLDCICCDRCRYKSRPQAGTPSAWKGPLFAAVLISFFLLLALPARDRPGASPTTDGKTRDTAGPVMPEDSRRHEYIDIERVRSLIRQGRLSDREAKYYHGMAGEKNQTMED
jgi:hypothetical protein